MTIRITAPMTEDDRAVLLSVALRDPGIFAVLSEYQQCKDWIALVEDALASPHRIVELSRIAAERKRRTVSGGEVG
jgi:hypothetical protein